jgi:thiol-disulfide isomerase/thioredoxin
MRAFFTLAITAASFAVRPQYFLRAAILVAATAIIAPNQTFAEDDNPIQKTTLAAMQLPDEGALPSLSGATEWLNSKPLAAGGLRGKVVLVEFWTYSCVNWRRTFPYVRAWAQKYKDRGLVVIGIHSPEFSFEKNVNNVRREARNMGVDYPIAIDNDFAVWRAFGNEFWPALYFVDARGHIRHHQFGEGEYDFSEVVIQQLLAEAGVKGVGHEPASVDPNGFEVAADWNDLNSPENYLGYERTENFAPPGGLGPDERRDYAIPARLDLNHWALSGDWTVKKEFVALAKAEGRIAYRFHARDLNLIMGATAAGTSVRFRVLVDGQPPGPAAGTDANAEGYGTVSEPRMYQLIRQPKPISDRQFEIEFLDPGVEAYDFTFG